MNDKELLQLIKNRRSIRKFKDIPIKKEDLLELVEAGVFAPSGSNTQCYRFLVITRQSDIDFLAKHKLGIINRAKAIIMVLADLNKCYYLKKGRASIFDKLPYQDTAIAMQNICLLAESKGIGNCIIHMSNNLRHVQKIRDRFNLSNNYEFMGVILLGYPNEIVNYKTVTHAGRPIKRDKIERYIVDWRGKGMEQDLKEVIEFLKDKNICLLGNAKITLKSKKDIDNFDIICRCNKGYPQGKEDYIGRRTDILFLSTTIDGQTILKNYNPKYVVWMTISNHLASKWVHENAYQNPLKQYKELKNKLSLRPTTGCIAFNFLINNVKFKNLTLYGFDFFTNQRYHPAHNPSEEKTMIMDIIKRTPNINLYVEK